MIRVGVLGARGRMGQWVTRLLESEYQHQAVLAATASREKNREEALDSLFNTDVVIDFSMPAGMLSVIERSAHISDEKLPAFVVGSTGWSPEEQRKLQTFAERTPVLMASNFSTGVQALLHILKDAAPLLERLGYTPVIVEAHHKHKKDAPSGTAISLQRAISSDNPGRVQTHSVRAGEVIGDHEITFYGPADHIAVGHFAQDRSIFARGALDAALWLSQKKKHGKVRTGAFISMETFFQEKFLKA